MSNEQIPIGDGKVVSISDAKKIMQDPAGSAGQPAAPVLSSPHIQDPGVATLLNQLPGLVGAIDMAIKDTAGKPLAFMLIVFTPGTVLHATNTDAKVAAAAVGELVDSWRKDGDAPGSAAANEAGIPAADPPAGD